MKIELNTKEVFRWAFSSEIETAAYSTQLMSNMTEEQLTQYMEAVMETPLLTPEILARAIGMDYMICSRFGKQKPRFNITDDGLVAYQAPGRDGNAVSRFYVLSLGRKPLFTNSEKRFVKSLFTLSWDRETETCKKEEQK